MQIVNGMMITAPLRIRDVVCRMTIPLSVIGMKCAKRIGHGVFARFLSPPRDIHDVEFLTSSWSTVQSLSSSDRSMIIMTQQNIILLYCHLDQALGSKQRTLSIAVCYGQQRHRPLIPRRDFNEDVAALILRSGPTNVLYPISWSTARISANVIGCTPTICPIVNGPPPPVIRRNRVVVMRIRTQQSVNTVDGSMRAKSFGLKRTASVHSIHTNKHVVFGRTPKVITTAVCCGRQHYHHRHQHTE